MRRKKTRDSPDELVGEGRLKFSIDQRLPERGGNASVEKDRQQQRETERRTESHVPSDPDDAEPSDEVEKAGETGTKLKGDE